MNAGWTTCWLRYPALMEPDELIVAEAELVAALEYFKTCIEDVREAGQ